MVFIANIIYNPPFKKVEPNSVAKRFMRFGSTFLKGGFSKGGY